MKLLPSKSFPLVAFMALSVQPATAFVARPGPDVRPHPEEGHLLVEKAGHRAGAGAARFLSKKGMADRTALVVPPDEKDKSTGEKKRKWQGAGLLALWLVFTVWAYALFVASIASVLAFWAIPGALGIYFLAVLFMAMACKKLAPKSKMGGRIVLALLSTLLLSLIFRMG